MIQTPLGFAAVAVPAQLSLLALSWVTSSYGDVRARGFRTIGTTALSLGAYVLIAVSTFAMLCLGDWLSDVCAPFFGEWQSDALISKLYEDITWGGGIALLLFIALVPAFVEELFFRGIIQRRLLARWSPAVVVPLVAVMFAVFHGTPLWALGVLPLGFWFGLLAWRTGSLWPGIVCHSFINGTVTGWRLGVAREVLPKHVSEELYYSLVAIAFASLAVSCEILRRYRRPDQQATSG